MKKKLLMIAFIAFSLSSYSQPSNKPDMYLPSVDELQKILQIPQHQLEEHLYFKGFTMVKPSANDNIELLKAKRIAYVNKDDDEITFYYYKESKKIREVHFSTSSLDKWIKLKGTIQPSGFQFLEENSHESGTRALYTKHPYLLIFNKHPNNYKHNYQVSINDLARNKTP